MIAIFGGTFDPVHFGHLNMAQQCVATFKLHSLYFMPCAIPAHKAAPGIRTEHRIAMLKTAIKPYSQFKLDLRELKRSGPSYSLLSLQELRAENPDTPILFLIGMDSFNNLDKWYQWQTITSLCHIVVYQRPGQNCDVQGELKNYKQQAMSNDISLLNEKNSGHLYFLEGKQLDAASSTIRQTLKKSIKKSELLPDTVSHYIQQHQLYQE